MPEPQTTQHGSPCAKSWTADWIAVVEAQEQSLDRAIGASVRAVPDRWFLFPGMQYDGQLAQRADLRRKLEETMKRNVDHAANHRTS